MTAHRSVKTFLILSASVFITFACNFVNGDAPTPIPPAETALPVATEVPTQVFLSPNSLPLANGLTLKSAADTEMTLSGFQATYIEEQAEGFSGTDQGKMDMYFTESQRFTVHVSAGTQPLVWSTGWCAQGQEKLNENLNNIQFEMLVNGQTVDLNQVYKVNDFRSWHISGNLCVLYRVIVTDWPAGTTTLTIRTIVSAPINDGINDYPAGEIIRTYEVIN